MKKIPEKKIYPTRFNGYYVGEDGTIWTHWDKSGYIGELRELTQYLRGGSNPNDRYLCVNISLKNDVGKTIKQIKYYSHKLIAETIIENPNNFTEINHIDRNKKNNNITNLEWTTRQKNMSHYKITNKNQDTIKKSNIIKYTPVVDINSIPQDWDYVKKRKRYKIIDLIKNIEYETESVLKWVKENWNYISSERTQTKNPKNFYNSLMELRDKKKLYCGFKVLTISSDKIENELPLI